MDAADHAQQLEEMQRKAAIEKIPTAQATWQSAENCRECDDPIPQKRRQLVPGVQYCTECQEVVTRA